MPARAPGVSAPSLRFPPARRLRKPGDFKRVYAGGRRSGNEYFTVNTQRNEFNAARLGMSVAVRALGGAVERNRMRRVIRESFRLNQSMLPPMDIIIGVRPAARAAEPARLRASLERIWQKLVESNA